MKQLITLFILALTAGVLVGCGADAPKATEEDRANIDRLLREGVGAPGSPGAPQEPGGMPTDDAGQPITP